MTPSSQAPHWRRGVVFAPNWLGDAVMCLPVLAALRRHLPACAWTVLARPAVAPVFEAAALDLHVELLPPPPSLRLRVPRADAVIVLPNSFYSALLARRVPAPVRIGYARDGRGWLLHPAVPPPAAGALAGHESLHYLELLRATGLLPALPAAPERVPLHPPSAAVAAWRARLHAPTAAIHVGASFGSAKRWLPDRFAALAAQLLRHGVEVVLVGSPGDRHLAESVRLQASGTDKVRNLSGQTSLAELIALLAAVDLLVANDSGPMHLAGALGTPVVALFGSTNERETYPLAIPGQLRLLKAPNVECSPCKLRTCPIDHRCMTRLSLEEVLAACLDALALPRP